MEEFIAAFTAGEFDVLDRVASELPDHIRVVEAQFLGDLYHVVVECDDIRFLDYACYEIELFRVNRDMTAFLAGSEANEEVQ